MQTSYLNVPLKLELIAAKFHDEAEVRNYKDTHVDLSMEMRILHNKSRDS